MKPELLSEIIRGVLRDNPTDSEKHIRDACWTLCRNDRAAVRALFDYWFGNTYRDFFIQSSGPLSVAVRRVDRSQTAAPRRRAVEALKEQMRACLLDHILSDGTPLRSATFGQCAQEGGWLLAIAKCGKAQEVVGKALTEQDVQNVWRRHRPSRAA
jgi:hypothetical protein